MLPVTSLVTVMLPVVGLGTLVSVNVFVIVTDPLVVLASRTTLSESEYVVVHTMPEASPVTSSSATT